MRFSLSLKPGFCGYSSPFQNRPFKSKAGDESVLAKAWSFIVARMLANDELSLVARCLPVVSFLVVLEFLQKTRQHLHPPPRPHVPQYLFYLGMETVLKGITSTPRQEERVPAWHTDGSAKGRRLTCLCTWQDRHTTSERETWVLRRPSGRGELSVVVVAPVDDFFFLLFNSNCILQKPTADCLSAAAIFSLL